MALCVIYPMPGLLHNKGRDGNLKQCQPGNDSPPLAWVTGLARAPENSYNRLQMASLCCSIGKNIFQFLYISIKNRSRLDSNPRTLDESQTSIPLDYGAMPFCFLDIISRKKIQTKKSRFCCVVKMETNIQVSGYF